MPTRKQQRVNELLLEELSLLIPGRLDDPRLADAVVTRVEATQDLSTAKVYVTGIGEDSEAHTREMLAALEHAGGFLGAELSDVGLRRLPHLVFARDRVYEEARRVLELLETLDPLPDEPVPPAGD